MWRTHIEFVSILHPRSDKDTNLRAHILTSRLDRLRLTNRTSRRWRKQSSGSYSDHLESADEGGMMDRLTLGFGSTSSLKFLDTSIAPVDRNDTPQKVGDEASQLGEVVFNPFPSLTCQPPWFHNEGQDLDTGARGELWAGTFPSNF